jgi:hypothetical protein
MLVDEMKGGDKPMPGRLWKSISMWLSLVAILTGLVPSSHAQSEPKDLMISGFQLIKYDETSERPLFRFKVVGTDEKGEAVPVQIQGALEKHLRVMQTNPTRKIYEPIYAVAASSGAALQNKRYMLVLFDVSGSMNESMGKTSKFVAAKEAVKVILNLLRPGIDYIAIAPFESHQVAPLIQKAKFLSDKARAIQELNNLPLPQSGNTGLFSAIQIGIRALQGIKDSGVDRSLIVMTDGQNDVKKDKNDDKELIEGAAVPKELIDQINSSQMAVYTIGFGGRTIDEPAMRKIAAPQKNNYLSAPDEKTLAQKFAIIGSYGINNISLLIAPEEKRLRDLNGVNRSFKVQLTLGSGRMLESAEEVTYRPPITDTPNTTELTTEEERKAIDKDPPIGSFEPGGGTGSSLPIWVPLLIYVALIAFLWFVLPRFIWPEHASAGPASAPPPAARRPMPNQQTGGAAATGWRTQSPGQAGRATEGRLGGSPRTNVGPDRTSSGPKQR